MGRPTKSKRSELEKMLSDPRVVSWRQALNTVEKLYARFEEELIKCGSNLSRFEILFHIYFSGPISAIQLSEKIGVSRGNISSFTKRLLADGLIEACPENSTDTRLKFILTRRGEKDFEEIFKLHLRHVKQVIVPLSKKATKELKDWEKHA